MEQRGTATSKQVALIALSFGAGATDAFAFLALGGIFTANMTGNLILIGLVQRAHYLETFFGAGIAIAVFVAALYVGFRRTRHVAPLDAQADESHIFQVLSAATIAQVAVFVGWLAAGASVALALQLLLIAFSATAMALQTVVGRRLSAQTGLTTTFVTGTLATLMQHLAEGAPGNRALAVVSVLALVVGAFVGAFCMLLQPVIAPLPPVIAMVISLFLIRPIDSQKSGGPAKSASLSA